MSLLRHPAVFAGGLVALGALLAATAASVFKQRTKPASAAAPPTPVLSKTGAPLDAGVAGKLVLVTGSSAGIGRAIAEAYARAGARVLVNGRSEASVSKAVASIQAVVGTELSANVLPLVGDVSSAEGAAALIKGVEAVGAPLDVLICNVGVYAVKPFGDIPDEEWVRYHEVNVMSCVRLARHFLPGMLARNWGRIVLVSSEVAERPLPHMVAYSVSKASQVNLARGLAELTKGTGVTVNSVLPGPTWTEGVEEYMKQFAASKGQTLEEACDDYFKGTETTSLLQRYILPAEVANTTLFIGSQLGAAINGHAQRVEGGIIRHI